MTNLNVMKKVLGAALVALMLVFSAGVTNAGNGRYYFNKDGGIIEVSLPDWMKWIPDDTLISDISIPGTHDAASVADGPTNNSVKTQQLSLREQLNAGIRAFDIRARHEDRGEGDRFFIYHGSVHQDDFCGDGEEANCGEFGDVLRIVGEFLKAHPKETVLMRLGSAGNLKPKGDISRTYEQTFLVYRDTTMDGSFIWVPPSGYAGESPTLRDVRGKIFILQNFEVPNDAKHGKDNDKSGWGNEYGMGWDDDADGPGTNMHIQDDFKLATIFDLSDKHDSVGGHFMATDSGTSDLLYVNFTSAAGGAFPQDFAKGAFGQTGMNEFTLNYLFLIGQNRTTGVVMMDFPGAGLISAIVAHNFKFGSANNYKRDWGEVVKHVVYSADGSDGGKAFHRGVQVKNFVRRVTKDRFVHVAALKKPFAMRWTADQLDMGIEDVNGMTYVVFGTKRSDGAFDTNTLFFEDVWMKGIIDKFSKDDGTGTRRAVLHNAAKNFFPGMHWVVIVKGNDGGFENWHFNHFGSSHGRVDTENFRHVLWNVAINRPPVARAGGPYVVNEGSSVMLDASGSTDPDGDSRTYRWDLDNNGTWDTTFSSSSSTSFNGIDDGVVTVKVEVSDGQLSDTDTAEVTVKNVAPTVSAADTQIDENGTAKVSATVSDPGTLDTFTVTFDWGDGSSTDKIVSFGTSPSIFSKEHQYLDDNPSGTASDKYNVTVTVLDDDNGKGVATPTVTVDNVAPIVAPAVYRDETGSIIGVDVGFVLVGMAVDVETTFTDIGTLDTHVAKVDWGDGSSSGATVIQTLGGGTLKASHTWAAPVEAVVTVTVTDDDTGVGTDIRVVSVLDPIDALKEISKDLSDLADDTSLSKSTQRALKRLLGYLEGDDDGAAENGALDLLEKGNEIAALTKIEDAVATIDKLLLAPDLDPAQLLTLKQMAKSLALTAKSVYVDLAEAAGAIATKESDLVKLAEAADLATEADSLLESGDVSGAVANWAKAVQKIELIGG